MSLSWKRSAPGSGTWPPVIKPSSPLNDALHRRQADAGAWVFRAPMQALKGAEQLVSIGHAESLTLTLVPLEPIRTRQ